MRLWFEVRADGCGGFALVIRRSSLADMKCPPSSGLLLPASFLERLMVEETEEGLFDD